MSARRADAVRLDWSTPVPRFGRVRVVGHTCECKARVYELCTSGGLAWVRRIDRHSPGETVRVTHPCRVGEAGELWALILAGEAR
ncbi:hypothetical protein [Nonomuraea longicatena]|uniref:hypothetical protein n=1 Tax=Nonomuraea longicatena TaxID=83682 RepID=UPI0031D139D4